jgi:uncharacterized OB-fold protein
VTVALQRCTACGAVQYPPRECCGACLSDALGWERAEAPGGTLLAMTVLHHSHEAEWRAVLPLRLGLVRLDAGPTVVCFVGTARAIGEAVTLRTRPDGLLEAT